MYNGRTEEKEHVARLHWYLFNCIKHLSFPHAVRWWIICFVRPGRDNEAAGPRR